MKLTFGLIAFLVVSAYGCRPVFRIYESRGYGEDYVENGAEMVTVNDVFDIADYGLEHSRMYTCPTGVWVGFRYPGFSGESNVVDGKYYSAIRCNYENTGRYFQSLKVVGNPNDYTASAVTTFWSRSNEMAATTHLSDTASISNSRFNSLILMGSQEMEVFTEENYTGTSFCIGPNNGHIYTKSDYDKVNGNRNGTELHTNLYDLENILGMSVFKSLRFGCNSNATFLN